MFPFPKQRSTRPPWATLGALTAVLALYELYAFQTAQREATRPRHGTTARLEAPRKSPDAAGRVGDWILSDPDGTSLTVAAAPDIAGHRPLLGAIVDVATRSGDVPDPLVWMRPVVVGKDAVTDLAVRPPQPFVCAGGDAGVRVYGALGVGLTTELCLSGHDAFRIGTTLTSLPDGASLGDEVNVGSLPFVVAREGAAWNDAADSSFFAFADGGTAVLVEAEAMHVRRSFSHFGAETFPSPVVVTYGPGKFVARTLHVVRGDVLSALARLRSATRAVDVTFGEARGGEVSVRDDAGRELALGHLARGETRSVLLPPDFGTVLVLTDERGIVTDEHVPIPPPGGKTAVRASPGVAGTLVLAYKDERGASVPVHALFQGNRYNDPPVPLSAEGRTVVAGRSLYLLDGHTRFAAAPGPYRITASHGPLWTLSQRDVVLKENETVTVEDVLRPVVDASGWTSADFHLHSAPSPDSSVSLADRVAGLVCEGVELAVATDHNRVTDLGPAAAALGVGDRLGTAPGVEISSLAGRFGHFNAYPLPLPGGAPEEGVPVYFERRPAELFASARTLGARVLQVNHARMDPGIGYFDLVHLDPKTGRSDAVFSTDFDVLEAFNGMWIESYEKIREGPRDVVALARRGKRVVVTGNSDSHRLLYQEAGYPRTLVHAPSDPAPTRVERVLHALLGGDTTVTSGPFVQLSVDGRPPGSVVAPGAASVHVRFRVSAPAWVPVERVELWRDDVVFFKANVPGPPRDGVRFEQELDVPVEGRDAVLLAWAEAATPLPDVVPYERPLAIGFTGPVYVDGNRDGRILVPPAP